jgi:hypothetical protein
LNDKTLLKDFNKSKYITVSLVAIIALLATANVFMFVNVPQTKTINENLGGLTGNVLITITDPNGTVVSQTKVDSIYAVSYDLIACVVWSSCANIGGLYNSQTPQTLTTTITLSQPYIDNFFTGFALSSTVQTNGACVNQLSGNGLTPIIANIAHTIGQNTPIVTLQGAFTYTGTPNQNVLSICLLMATENTLVSGATPGVLSSTTSLASENIGTQTLSTGQSISFSWTFNM